MEADFDPYHEWLGIPKSEQPANHYRLLGLPLGESESEAIQNAADERMRHIRTFQIGKHSEVSQKLLNEIAAAKLLLLNPKRRAAYDQKLAEPPPPDTSPEPPANPVSPLAEPSARLERGVEPSSASSAQAPALVVPPRLSVGTPFPPPPVLSLQAPTYAPAQALEDPPLDAPNGLPPRPPFRLAPLAAGLGAAAAIVGLGVALSFMSRSEEVALPEPPAPTTSDRGREAGPSSAAAPTGPADLLPPFPPQSTPPGGIGRGGGLPPGGPPRRLPDGRMTWPDGRAFDPRDPNDPNAQPPGFPPPGPPPGFPFATPGGTNAPGANPGSRVEPQTAAAPVKPLVPPPDGSPSTPGPDGAAPSVPGSDPPGANPGTSPPAMPPTPEVRGPNLPGRRPSFPSTPFGSPGMSPPGSDAPFGPFTPPPNGMAPPSTPASGNGFPNFAKEAIVELLPWVDPERDALAWPPYRRSDDALQSDPNEFSRCFLPFPTPSEFRLVVEITRGSFGQPFVIAYTLGGGSGGIMLSLRENGGEVVGRGGKAVFGAQIPWNAPTLTPGARRRIAFTVRMRRIVVEVEGRTVLDQNVDLAQFDLGRETISVPVNYPWRVMLGSHRASDRIHRVAWASLDAEARPSTPPPPTSDFLGRIRERNGEPGRSTFSKETARRWALDALNSAAVTADLSEKHHLLDVAKEWGVELVDADLTFEAIDRRFETFAGDPVEAKAEAFGELVRKADSPQAAELFRLGMPLFRMAVRAEKAAVAERIVDQLGILAGKTVSTAAAANAAKQSLKLIREQADRASRDLKPARDARVKLAGDPDDAAANLVLGRYYCFVREDWSRGAEHLRKGDNPQLAKLAEQEQHPPVSGPDRAALADAWKKALDGAILAHKPAILRRAAMWRQAAVRRLEGVPQAAERKKLEDLGPFNLDPWDAAAATAFRDKVFFYHPPVQRGWKAAEEWARQRGGHLACIRATLEADFVANYAASFGPKTAYFLGGTDEGNEGKWRWVDGAPFAFARWEGGAPNNFGGRENFLTARAESKQWNDVPEEHDGASIVQWPLPKEWPKEP